MSVKFSQFTSGGNPSTTDTFVGLSGGLNTKFTFTGIKDSVGNALMTFATSSGIGVTFNGTGAMNMPVGTTAQQPAGVTGAFRYNSTLNYPEYYNGSAYVPFSTGSVVSVSGTTNQIQSTGGVTPVLSLSSTVVFPGTATLASGNSLTFYDASNSNYARLQAPTLEYVASAIYQLPRELPPSSAGYVLSSSGTGVMSWILPSGGDVVGPASSIDNRVVRFDGTTGKLIQGSVVGIDDSGNISTSGNLSAAAVAATVGDITCAGNALITGITRTGGGTVSAPGFTFTGKTTTGMYSSAARAVDFTGGGTRILSLTASASAVNYLIINAPATGSGVTLTTAGTDTDVDLTYTGKASNSKLVITRTGSITAPTISDSAGTTGISFPSSGQVTLVGGGTTLLDVRQAVGSANNYLQIYNAENTGPLLTPAGAGAGTGLDVFVAGSGADSGLAIFGDFTATTPGILKIFETDNTDYVALQAPSTLTTSTTYILPSDYPSSDGQSLTCTTTGTMTWGGGGSSIVTQVFTSSGTYTPTVGMKYCIIECVGGGGGGGGSQGGGTGAAAGGGGGAGAYARADASAAAVGASQTVTIGAAGAAGAAGNNAGGGGGTTSVGTLASAGGGTGGGGGGNAAGINFGVPGLGGTATIGDVQAAGEPGFTGVSYGTISTFGIAGHGASSLYGGGGHSAITANGIDAVGYGSGGGGGASAASNQSGGAGTAGIVIITEFI